jgi:uncharacterized lipoprotein YajG
MLKQEKIAALIVMVLFLGGCATSRGIVDLTIPVSTTAGPSSGKTVYINSVVDERSFEAKPKSADIPSLDPDEQQNDSIRLRAIARKRNGFGKALGDILLKEGQTVESVIHDALRQAFVEQGYRVIENKQLATDDTAIVDARIHKFWSWMNPGFWAISLSTEISTGIGIKSAGAAPHEETVSVKASDRFQTGVGSNWLEVMHTALKEYIDEVKRKFK